MSAGNATGSSRAAGVSPCHALALATISLPSWVCWALTCGRAVGASQMGLTVQPETFGDFSL